MEQRMWNIIHGKIKGNPQLYACCYDFLKKPFVIYLLLLFFFTLQCCIGPTSIHIEKNN